jgi:tryptophan synthase alpha subunit
MLAAIRQKHPTIPIGLLMYANLVFNRGIDEFYAECARVGVDSVLVADVPVEESAPFRQAAMRHNVARFSSARRTPMTNCCARLPLTAAVTPTCSPAQA